jgi:hypothetical protein
LGVTVAAVVPRYCCGDRRIAAGDRPALSPNFILFSFAEKKSNHRAQQIDERVTRRSGTGARAAIIVHQINSYATEHTNVILV